tara:strand:+ start:2633 stop:3952 length:1320 start_codon:yes stop_codon:yes gene_type:complete
MSIFAEILCKQFPSINLPCVNYKSIQLLRSAYNYSSLHSTTIKLVYHIYFLNYKSLHKSILNKFDILNSIVLNDKNIDNYDKNYFLNNFSNAQKTYSSLRKFANLYKFKHLKKFEIDTDLCCNNFSTLSKNITINLIENDIIYKFRISDLINIINQSLSHSPYFFSQPYDIRNPYTNIPFSYANLYNIYFKIKQTNFIMPLLFNLYFLSNFNLTHFKNSNECYIRDFAINNFINNATTDELYQYILKMFYCHYNCILFDIDRDFPKSKLVKVFKNFLKSYLFEEYSLNPYIREINKSKLDFKLTMFSQLNPNFGKKIWIRKRRHGEVIMYYSFNDNVIESSDLIQYTYPITNHYDYNNENSNFLQESNNDIPNENETNIDVSNNYILHRNTLLNSIINYMEEASDTDDNNEETDNNSEHSRETLDQIIENYQNNRRYII